MFKQKFEKKNNIFVFENKVNFSKIIDNFYSLDPFPNYTQNDNKLSILNKGDKNIIAKKLKNEIGFGKKILEVGSGTSQLSQYFALGTNNKVVAFDATFTSLELGSNFSIKNNIKNVTFVNGDIFEDIFNHEYFDLVWCSGVLHHTKDPKAGFDQIIKYLKINGYIIIGLYNTYGRLFTKIRQLIYKIIPKYIRRVFIMNFDPYLRSLKDDDKNRLKINSWIRDQYEHPHESTHTIDEVMRWFEKQNVNFIGSIPASNFNADPDFKILEKATKGSFFERTFNQILMIFNSFGKEGGLFLVIGKKNDSTK